MSLDPKLQQRLQEEQVLFGLGSLTGLPGVRALWASERPQLPRYYQCQKCTFNATCF
jgi:hypothetical protein